MQCVVVLLRGNISSFLFHAPSLSCFMLTTPPMPAIQCAAITLTNGLTGGNCNGNYNSTCTYASCNDGFNMSTTGSSSRTCGISGVYSGTAKTCVGTHTWVYFCGGYWEGVIADMLSLVLNSSRLHSPLHFLNPWSPAITCPALSLANGNVSGNCTGRYNDTCTYATCNEGFALSSFGSTSRRCNASGVYSGTEKQCLRE